MFEDLRTYLSYLEDKGQLLRVQEEVDSKFEIAAGIRKTSDIQGPALLFEKVKGFPGWRVLGGLFATRKLIALALGIPEDRLLEQYLTLEEKRIPPEIVETGPVKEICWKGDQVDLRRLPMVTHSEKDCGPYVTIGVQIGKDPDTGIRNVSIHRMLLLQGPPVFVGARRSSLGPDDFESRGQGQGNGSGHGHRGGSRHHHRISGQGAVGSG